jgi:chromosome segregation ATPase
MEDNEIVKIQARVPNSLWSRLEPFRFKSQNEAVNYAFEKLVEQKDINQNEPEINQNEPEINQNEPNLINQIQMRLEEKELLIKTINNQIELLTSQLVKKDEQLEKQSYHIQTLIQENSKLNLKLLPETIENKKPWSAIPVLNKNICGRQLNFLIFRNNFITLSTCIKYGS